MKIGLFIPCYIDQFFPEVGIATLQVLERLGIEVSYPASQTCCGQPMANAGYENYSQDTHKLFRENFSGFEYVVAPSGSCVHHVKHHIGSEELETKTYELCTFLEEVVGVTKEQLNSSFNKKVGLHQSCHGLRGLNMGTPSELMNAPHSVTKSILSKVEGIELVDLNRTDECCGFGGSFSVSEEDISIKMGKDRLKDHIANGADIITGADMSCLMHLKGIADRQKSAVKIMHIAEILNQTK